MTVVLLSSSRSDGVMVAVGFIPRLGIVREFSRRGATLENVG